MSDDDAARAFAALVRIMARLRAPGGCPWDREQTWRTLRTYVLEEAYEVVDAIERDDPQALREELGDLLLQIVFQAEIAHEHGHFTIADVVYHATTKEDGKASPLLDKSSNIYALSDDIQIRGMKDADVDKRVKVVSYGDIVDLMFNEFDKTAWL